jgi:hypothetical protein
VGVAGGVEIVASAAQLVHALGGILITVDATNGFNALSRAKAFLAVAEHAPDLFDYMANIYGRERADPLLLFGLDGEEKSRFVPSQQGVQQGDSLGPLIFALTVLPILRDFKLAFPALALPSFLDDLTIMCLAHDQPLPARLAHLRGAYDWLKQRLLAVGLAVNPAKSACLLPATVTDADVPAAAALDEEGEAGGEGAPMAVGRWVQQALGGIPTQAGVDAGVTLVGVPIGTPASVRAAVCARLRNPENDRFLHELVRLKHPDPHLSYTLLRLCYLPGAMFLARNLGPEQCEEELMRFDMLTLGALAAILQEPSMETDGAADDDWSATVRHARSTPVPAPGPDGPREVDALRQHVTLPSHACMQVRLSFGNGGLGLPSMAARAPVAFLGRMLDTLEGALAIVPAEHRHRLQAGLADAAGQGAGGAPLLSTLPLQQVRRSLLQLHAAGVSWEQLGEAGVPSAWLDWAQDKEGSAEALMAHLLPVAAGGEYAEAPLPRHGARHQARLNSCFEEAEKRRYDAAVASVADRDNRLATQSRANSQAHAGSMAFLTVLPTFDPQRSLPPHQFREAGRRAVGEERPVMEAARCSKPGCARQPLTGSHGRRCPGGFQFRHDLIKNRVVRGLKDSGLIGVLTEDHSPFVRVEGGQRMDITIPGGQLSLPFNGDPETLQPRYGANAPARAVLLDITLHDNTCATHLERAARESGHAAQLGYLEKFNQYGGSYSRHAYTLFPLSIEHHGYVHDVGGALLKAVAHYEHVRSGGMWPVSRALTRWRQLVSVALQAGLSTSVDMCLGNAIGPFSNRQMVGGFLTRKFLVPPRL